jgi:hypothetical protein
MRSVDFPQRFNFLRQSAYNADLARRTYRTTTPVLHVRGAMADRPGGLLDGIMATVTDEVALIRRPPHYKIMTFGDIFMVDDPRLPCHNADTVTRSANLRNNQIAESEALFDSTGCVTY